jgi:hypothetical protein
MSGPLIENLPIGQLHSWLCNARAHSRKQIRQIAESIRLFGFTNPVLIDGENRILAGHGRVAAARELGMATVPCLRVHHMTAADKRAYVPADNKLALNAGWDEELLALELKELMGRTSVSTLALQASQLLKSISWWRAWLPRSRGTRRMTGFRTPTGFLRDASQAICGDWGHIGSFAATRWIRKSSPP